MPTKSPSPSPPPCTSPAIKVMVNTSQEAHSCKNNAPWNRTTLALLLSPSAPPSPFCGMPPGSLSGQTKSLLNISFDDLAVDTMPSDGYVLVPAGTWPECMYACNMASGITLMDSDRSASDVGDKFQCIFAGAVFRNGQSYVRGTWLRQRKFFLESTFCDQDIAMDLPHDKHGLWVTWRAATSVRARKRIESWSTGTPDI
ncbi:hypothetical protein EV421DRAFT_1911826 [Armillaria borealis]|uniref:Uncharacterized protein n=1 Tax=Armillaria borealis TaxID=47425 RepID=A0AA39IZ18_9AGAR|nr:hypothetical protein EV421DRAFT_1911826 [Armillaria borealis]